MGKKKIRRLKKKLKKAKKEQKKKQEKKEKKEETKEETKEEKAIKELFGKKDGDLMTLILKRMMTGGGVSNPGISTYIPQGNINDSSDYKKWVKELRKTDKKRLYSEEAKKLNEKVVSNEVKANVDKNYVVDKKTEGRKTLDEAVATDAHTLNALNKLNDKIDKAIEQQDKVYKAQNDNIFKIARMTSGMNYMKNNKTGDPKIDEQIQKIADQVDELKVQIANNNIEQKYIDLIEEKLDNALTKHMNNKVKKEEINAGVNKLKSGNLLDNGQEQNVKDVANEQELQDISETINQAVGDEYSKTKKNKINNEIKKQQNQASKDFNNDPKNFQLSSEQQTELRSARTERITSGYQADLTDQTLKLNDEITSNRLKIAQNKALLPPNIANPLKKPLQNSKGKPIRFLGVPVDIDLKTSRKESENQTAQLPLKFWTTPLMSEHPSKPPLRLNVLSQTQQERKDSEFQTKNKGIQELLDYLKEDIAGLAIAQNTLEEVKTQLDITKKTSESITQAKTKAIEVQSMWQHLQSKHDGTETDTEILRIRRHQQNALKLLFESEHRKEAYEEFKDELIKAKNAMNESSRVQQFGVSYNAFLNSAEGKKIYFDLNKKAVDNLLLQRSIKLQEKSIELQEENTRLEQQLDVYKAKAMEPESNPEDLKKIEELEAEIEEKKWIIEQFNKAAKSNREIKVAEQVNTNMEEYYNSEKGQKDIKDAASKQSENYISKRKNDRNKEILDEKADQTFQSEYYKGAFQALQDEQKNTSEDSIVQEASNLKKMKIHNNVQEKMLDEAEKQLINDLTFLLPSNDSFQREILLERSIVGTIAKTYKGTEENEITRAKDIYLGYNNIRNKILTYAPIIKEHQKKIISFETEKDNLKAEVDLLKSKKENIEGLIDDERRKGKHWYQGDNYFEDAQNPNIQNMEKVLNEIKDQLNEKEFNYEYKLKKCENNKTTIAMYNDELKGLYYNYNELDSMDNNLTNLYVDYLSSGRMLTDDIKLNADNYTFSPYLQPAYDEYMEYYNSNNQFMSNVKDLQKLQNIKFNDQGMVALHPAEVRLGLNLEYLPQLIEKQNPPLPTEYNIEADIVSKFNDNDDIKPVNMTGREAYILSIMRSGLIDSYSVLDTVNEDFGGSFEAYQAALAAQAQEEYEQTDPLNPPPANE